MSNPLFPPAALTGFTPNPAQAINLHLQQPSALMNITMAPTTGGTGTAAGGGMASHLPPYTSSTPPIKSHVRSKHVPIIDPDTVTEVVTDKLTNISDTGAAVQVAEKFFNVAGLPQQQEVIIPIQPMPRVGLIEPTPLVGLSEPHPNVSSYQQKVQVSRHSEIEVLTKVPLLQSTDFQSSTSTSIPVPVANGIAEVPYVPSSKEQVTKQLDEEHSISSVSANTEPVSLNTEQSESPSESQSTPISSVSNVLPEQANQFPDNVISQPELISKPETFLSKQEEIAPVIKADDSQNVQAECEDESHGSEPDPPPSTELLIAEGSQGSLGSDADSQDEEKTLQTLSDQPKRYDRDFLLALKDFCKKPPPDLEKRVPDIFLRDGGQSLVSGRLQQATGYDIARRRNAKRGPEPRKIIHQPQQIEKVDLHKVEQHWVNLHLQQPSAPMNITMAPTTGGTGTAAGGGMVSHPLPYTSSTPPIQSHVRSSKAVKIINPDTGTEIVTDKSTNKSDTGAVVEVTEKLPTETIKPAAVMQSVPLQSFSPNNISGIQQGLLPSPVIIGPTPPLHENFKHKPQFTMKPSTPAFVPNFPISTTIPFVPQTHSGHRPNAIIADPKEKENQSFSTQETLPPNVAIAECEDESHGSEPDPPPSTELLIAEGSQGLLSSDADSQDEFNDEETLQTLSDDLPKRYDRDFLLALKDFCKKPPPDLERVPDIFMRDGGQALVSGGPQQATGYDTARRRNTKHGPEPRKTIHQPQQIEKVDLHKAEQRWVRHTLVTTEMTEEEKETMEIYRKLQGILNKLTPQKFQSLAEQALKLKICTEERLQGCIDKIFTKALNEPVYSIAYANLCKVLSLLKVDWTEERKPRSTNFRRVLLTKCQTEFEKGIKDDEDLKQMRKGIEEAQTPEESKQLQEELDVFITRARKRSLGSIRFMGELFKLQMLSETIMHECVVRLLKSTSDEESLECFARLITTTGKELDVEKAKQRIDGYFGRIGDIIKKDKIPARIKFMLQDVQELRRNKWVPRQNQASTLKTINQIRAEAKVELVAQYQAGLSYPKGHGADERRCGSRSVWKSKREKERARDKPKLDTRKIAGPVAKKEKFGPPTLGPQRPGIVGGVGWNRNNASSSPTHTQENKDKDKKPTRASSSGVKRNDKDRGPQGRSLGSGTKQSPPTSQANEKQAALEAVLYSDESA